MDVSSCRRLEPTYAFKPSSSSPNPYSSSFANKPSLLCRPPHLPLTKLPKLTILSDNEARACSSSNSHDHHSILDTSSLGNKLHGTLNASPPNHLINRTIKTVNGHGSANGATTNNTISSSCVSTVEEAATTSTFQASSSSQQAAWAALLQDADISNYMKIMQALYLRDHPPPSEGLGIVEFLKGKNLFITGATGFLAKVLVEKILRVQPDVGQLFLLIKGKDVHHATKRLQDEIIHSQLFNNLKSCYGGSYQQFMERKITPIVGNIASSNLGMDAHTAEALQRKLDIIINSAASTTFDERYDHALNLNTRGAQRIVEFGRSCMHLQLLMHVSTAFVNGERKGVVKEKTFKIGYSIANEALKSNQDSAPDINVEMESRVIQKRINDILNEDQNLKSVQIPQLNDQQREKKLQEAMKELGMERAKRFGWQDTYVFTKAMGEMLVDSTRGQLPVVIIRPSVVESSFKDPFPGWMEGNRMMDPIIISYGKGQLPGFLVDPKSVLDVVPVDMVANAMLAAMAKHASKPGLEVYQVASSVVNPLLFSNLAEMSREHFLEHPFKDNVGKPLKIHDLQLFQDMDSFMNAVTSCSQSIKEKIPSTLNAEIMLKRHTQLTLKVRQQAAYLANLYRPYTFYAGRFDNSKTQQLYSSLSQQEKETFGFDVSEVDWETYIKTIHIPGLRKHVLKGRGSNM